MESLKEKAKALLQQCEVVTLTSINKEGYPRPVPLSKIKTEGLTTIWFATGNSSAKTKDFRSNPKAGICFYKEGKTIRLWGAYPEGMSFAILIMNSVVPLINKYVKPRRFGLK